MIKFTSPTILSFLCYRQLAPQHSVILKALNGKKILHILIKKEYTYAYLVSICKPPTFLEQSHLASKQTDQD